MNLRTERIFQITIPEPRRPLCFLAVPGQAGLEQSWNMEQRGRSADTVSCQPLSASVSLRESPSKSSTVHWSTYNSEGNDIVQGSTICGCSLVSPQVGTCQSELSVSNPPDRAAFTQRYLLCHRRTPARLHGHPQTDRHPIYKSPERRVSLLPVLAHFSMMLQQHFISPQS